MMVYQKQLEYFLVLSKIGSITQAADALFLTRQALSGSIKGLEQELGAPLFVRSKSGVELTEIGKKVEEFAGQQMLQWQKLVEQAHLLTSKKVIRVGTHLMHLDTASINAITEFQETEPDIKFTFYDDEDYTAFWKMLKEGEIDVARTRKAPESAALCWVKLADYRVFIFVGAENPLAKRKRIDFMKDLKNQNYLSVSKDTSEEIAPHLKVAQITHEYVTPNQTLLKQLIKSDCGIFVAPEIAIPSLTSEGIAVIELENFPIEVGGFLVYRPNPPDHINRYIEYVIRRAHATEPNSTLIYNKRLQGT
jgi:DNA-binding transcriptional LysR family regulator